MVRDGNILSTRSFINVSHRMAAANLAVVGKCILNPHCLTAPHIRRNFAVGPRVLLMNSAWIYYSYIIEKQATNSRSITVFLALKNTPLAILTAYSYERLNSLHRIAGYTTLVYTILRM